MNDHFWVRIKEGQFMGLVCEARTQYTASRIDSCEKTCCRQTEVKLPEGWFRFSENLIKRIGPIEVLAAAAE